MKNAGGSISTAILVLAVVIVFFGVIVISNLPGGTHAIDILPAGQAEAVNTAIDEAAKVCATTDLCDTDNELPGLWTKFWGLFDF